MNAKSIRRILSLFALTAALAISVVAHADPLVLPNLPQGGPVVIVPPVTLFSPPAGVEVNSLTGLTWSHSEMPVKYKLKFYIVPTGETLKVKVPLESCGGAGFCVLPIGSTPLFDHLSDGDSFNWRVIAKYGKVKVKSAANMQIANTVDAPDTLLPVHGSNLYSGAELQWDDDMANASYTLIVKKISSGERVIKQKIPATACPGTCAADAFELTELIDNHGYNWFVKSKGFNGDVATSAKQTFYAQSVAHTD